MVESPRTDKRRSGRRGLPSGVGGYVSPGRLPDKRVTPDAANAIPARSGLLLVGFGRTSNARPGARFIGLLRFSAAAAALLFYLPCLAMAEALCCSPSYRARRLPYMG